MRWFRQLIIFIALSFGLAPSLVVAANQSSTNFQNIAPTFAPAYADVTSPNFKVTGSVDYAVGAANSPSFSVQSGVPIDGPSATPSPTPSTPAGGGGSGSYVGYVVPPTFTYKTPTYQSHQQISGTRGSRETVVSVNGSSVGVTYPSDSAWQVDLPLFLGQNTIIVKGSIPSGYTTPSIGGMVERRLIGDANNDRSVNDRDLSILSRAFRRFNLKADFNEDGKVDDIDLSLLASHWGQSY